MVMRIRQLPPALANQIAAGEVIERPASIVKELLENALDAKANQINIEIGYGGLNQVKISDNGLGIIAEDLPLAIAAHATSKISELKDLYAINSMGFRGEALASIASIARVSINSKPFAQESAMMLECQGQTITLTPSARAQGTTIDVRDIFYNAPVRKKFLKSERTEFQAIESIVKRFALSAPEIEISLSHNGKLQWQVSAATEEHSRLLRISKLLGKPFVDKSIYLDVNHAQMRLYGWISGPDYQRSQNDKLWVYLNGRMVKDKLINHAIKQAYENLLYPGRNPTCLLYLTIEPSLVDVNVHPTKHEVRFQEPRLIHDFISSQLSHILQGADFSTPLVREAEQIENNSELREQSASPVYMQNIPQSDMHSNKVPQIISNSQCSSEYSEGLALRGIIFNPRIPPLSGSSCSARKTTFQITGNIRWTVLNQGFVLCFLQQEPYLVDFLQLHRQLLQQSLENSTYPLKCRPLLVPIHMDKVCLDTSLSGPAKILLKEIGIELDELRRGDFSIRSLPILAPNLDIKRFITDFFTSLPLDLESAITLLVQHQEASLLHLGEDDRLACISYLQSLSLEALVTCKFIKHLSSDLCVGLFDVQ